MLRWWAQMVRVRPASAGCTSMCCLPDITVIVPRGGTRASNSTATPSAAGAGSGSLTGGSRLGLVRLGSGAAFVGSRVGPCGRNRLAGVAMSSDWWGRWWL